MSKGYILMEIPENCASCEMQLFDECLFYYADIAERDVSEYVSDGTKPSDCPIKTLPSSQGYRGELADGYNLCLDELQGGGW